MKPYENLQKFDRLINNLKYQLRYSKNKKESDKILIGISEVRNSFNEFLNGYFYADVLETLILDLLLTKIKFDTEKANLKIYDLEAYLAEIGQIIKQGKNVKASELIDYLRIPYQNMTIKDYDKNQDLERASKIFKRIPTEEFFLNNIQELINILKSDICLIRS